VPATLVTMQTKVELNTTPPTPEPVGNAHVLLGTEGPENSPGVDTQPVISEAPVAPPAPAQALPVQVAPATPVEPNQLPPAVPQTQETQPAPVDVNTPQGVAPVAPTDPSAPPVEH
jgi:hypothetical protein